MDALDFDLSKDIKFDFNTGITTFRKSRLIIMDANSVGFLRQDLVQMLGEEKARELFLRFSFQNGYADFMQMKLNYKFNSEIELLASGPVIHTWEGIVKATPKELSFDRLKGEFKFTGTWLNSYEAEQYLTFNSVSKLPVCWSLMGYASGWCTAFFGKPILAIEPVCVGMGDACCEWDLRPANEWGEKGEPYRKALKDLLK